MMKQAQELQGRMQKMQEDLAGLEVEGQSGAGLVKVKINGKFEARGLKIDPSLIKPEEAEILEDLIVAAFQDAKTKAEAAVQAKMQELTGGLQLPAGPEAVLALCGPLRDPPVAPPPRGGRKTRHDLARGHTLRFSSSRGGAS